MKDPVRMVGSIFETYTKMAGDLSPEAREVLDAAKIDITILVTKLVKGLHAAGVTNEGVDAAIEDAIHLTRE